MIIPYELSLWVDYPGDKGIQEEKLDIIAASGTEFPGRAENIKLHLSYTGQHTLEFEIPVRYFDAINGTQEINPLVSAIQVKNKLKLWRDELWFNPFGGNYYIDEDDNTIYEGIWEQGRWYEFVVSERSEKRQKKRLYYSYKCVEAFSNELSRTGYNLEFTSEDIMSISGLGTVHTLTERTLQDTDWQYIKTETFPDHKEEFGLETGETIRTPVITEEIEVLNSEKRYAYVYDVNFSDDISRDEDDNPIWVPSLSMTRKVIQAFSDANALEFYHSLPIDEATGISTLNWYRNLNDKKIGKITTEVYGYDKTEIITSYADALIAQDGGVYKESDNGPYKRTTNTILFDSTSGWEPANNQDIVELDAEEISIISENSTNTNSAFKYKLKFRADGERPRGYLSTSLGSEKLLDAGDLLAVKIGATYKSGNDYLNCPYIQVIITDGEVTAENLWDGVSVIRKNNIPWDCTITEGANTAIKFADIFMPSGRADSLYEDTYYIQIPSRIKNPYFYFWFYQDANNVCPEVFIERFYAYRLKGFNEDFDKAIRDKITNTIGDCWKLTTLNFTTDDVTDATAIDILNNTITVNGVETPFWLPFGQITQNNYQEANTIYCVEVYKNGEYIPIYLPKPTAAIKRASYKTDKRRAITASKSNRFAIIQELCKKFSCFSRFIVEHEPNGQIKKNQYGIPIKKLTMVSTLGQNRDNGFDYGVNLESVERKLIGDQVVSKMYVENKDNQYDENGTVSIVDSELNKLGEQYIYNFAYYLNRGILDKEQFMLDYNTMYEEVSGANSVIRTKNSELLPLQQYCSEQEALLDAYKMIQSSLRSNAEKKLQYLKDPMQYYNDSLTDNSTEKPSVFPNIVWKKYHIDSWVTTGIEIWAEWYSTYQPSNTSQATSSGVQYSTASGLSKEDIENAARIITQYQTSYNNYTNKINIITSSLEGTNGIKQKIINLQNEYDFQMLRKQRAIMFFEKKYSQYITEGTWSADGYIDSNLYYTDATRALTVSCMPKVEYNINVIDLTKMSNPFDPNDKEWGQAYTIDIGDTSYVSDKELFGLTRQKVMVAEKDIYIDIHKPDDIKLRNYETRFEDLFQSIAATVTTVSLNENIYSRAQFFNPTGVISNSVLEKTMNNNYNLAISVNDEVKWDKSGIRITDLEDINKRVHITSKGIFVTKDGGLNFTAGITADGINTSLLTAGEINTSQITIISGSTETFAWNKYGITGYVDKSLQGSGLPTFIRLDQFGLYGAVANENKFNGSWYSGYSYTNALQYVWDNSIFSLTAKGLKIEFEENYLKADVQGNILEFSGKLVAASGDFTGRVTANEGEIAGWTIQEYVLQTKDVYAADRAGMYLCSDPEALGRDSWIAVKSSDGNWPFHVTKEGKLVSTNAEVWGTVEASTGHIGIWQIDNLSLSYGFYKKNANNEYELDSSGNRIPISPSIDTSKKVGALVITPHSHSITIGNSGEKVAASIYLEPTTGHEQAVSGHRFAINILGWLYSSGLEIWGYNEQTTDGIPIPTTRITAHGSDMLFISKQHSTWTHFQQNYGAGLMMDETKVEVYGSWVQYGSWTTSAQVNSDRNLKNSIIDFTENYSIFFDNIQPRLYKYNDGTSNRRHSGFIAQEIDEALQIAKIPTQDFAGLVILNKDTEQEKWALRYEEFISLNTWQIQKAKARIVDLEARVAQLENLIYKWNITT